MIHPTCATGAHGSQTARGVAPAGEADVLALLLDGTPTADFPLTLEAALAGEAAADPIAEEVGDGGGSPGGDDGAAIDAALAAALALGGAGPAGMEEGARSGGAPDGAAAVGVAASTDADAQAGAAERPTMDPRAVATGDAAAGGADGLAGSADASRGSEPQAPLPAPHDAAAGEREARPVPVPAGPDDPAAGRGSAERARGSAEGAAPPAARTPEDADGAHRQTGAGEHFPGAGAGDDDATASFEHEDPLGSKEEAWAGARPATAHPAAASVPNATATTPGLPGEATHATRVTSAADANTAAPLAAETTTTGHAADPGATRVDRTPLPPGTIEARWHERVADAVRLSAARGGGEIRLQLEPEGLGHIDVRLHLHADGVRAVIVAEHESTRALLQSQQQILQDAFGRSDLRLAGFSVDVGSGDAARFAWPDAHGEGGDANGPTSEAPRDASPADAPAPAAPALPPGRVSVRV